MKKVTNITIGGLVFTVEDDAYETLRSYLATLETHFEEDEDKTEILADIESAIAEKLSKSIGKGKVVTHSHVETIISEMGHAQEFDATDTERRETEAEKESSEDAPEPKKQRRLYRDPDDKIIAGVASGIAAYFGIDPVIVRIVFVLAVFLNGLGIIAYILLWLIVPKALTTEQKYQMRGERVTISNIQQEFRTDKEGSSVKKNGWDEIKGFLSNLFELFGTILQLGLKALGVIVGMVFVLVGTIGTAGLVFATSFLLFFVDPGLYDADIQAILETVTGSASGIAAVVALGIVALIPLLVLIIIGTSLLRKQNQFTGTNVAILGITWIVAIGVLGGTLASLAPKLGPQIEQVVEKHHYYEYDWHNGHRHDRRYDRLPVPPIPPVFEHERESVEEFDRVENVPTTASSTNTKDTLEL